MLPRPQRVRTADEFAVVVRSGCKAGSARLVVHAIPGPAKAGFIVSKAVGPAVVRNRVKRRLRHLMRERLDGHTVVVRALPRAAEADHRTLRADLDRCLERAAR